MIGKIQRYFSEKGYGFIKDENGDNRFFHISNIRSTNDITVGSTVEFTPNKNNKGLIAESIIIKKVNTPKFIVLDDVRIKLNNIKNYGIDYRDDVKVEKKLVPMTKKQKVINKVIGVPLGITEVISGINESTPGYGLKDLFNSLTADSYVEKTEKKIKYKVLYITTYQGDNYRFDGEFVSFSIEEKVKQLDEYFGNI